MQILSQRDPQWAKIQLGTSDKTIGTHGCTITAIASLLNLTPPEVNQKILSVGGYAQGNLVIWGKLSTAFPHIKSATRYWEYDNEIVKDAIQRNGGCLVEVDGSRIGASKHWVLYIGQGQMIDPWFGNQKSTSYYRPTGFAVLDLATMPEKTYSEEEMTKMREERDQNWDLYIAETKLNDDLREELSQTKSIFEQRREQLAKNLNTVNDWDEIVKASGRFKTLDEQNQELEDKLERERQEHKRTVLEYEDKLQALKDEMELMKEDHQKQIAEMQKRVDKEIEDLQKAKEQYDTTVKIISWIKSIFERKS